ncbi:MAG TPA: HAMP domain-containing sensor histidine kinase [Rhizomicrobium sp.]|nr:HAMP domain-containing sensor histidine kinase [Rhizomicrobium sp.]
MTSSEQDLTAGMLAARTPALTDGTTCGEVFDWFVAHPAVPAAAILHSQTGAVLGLINRFIFFASYAKQYVPELFSRKSILKLANRHPLVVDGDVRLADLGATLLVENPDALIECFVVTRRGRYLGVGTGEALLQGKVKLLQAREQELSRALQAETRANAAKSDFLALMSHELRTPLNAIIGFSEVLGTEMLGPLGHPRYREYAHDVHGAGGHLLALINDILDLSKAAAGKFELACEEISPADIVAECVRLTRGKAHEGGLRLTSEMAPGLPNLMVDRLRFKQALLNLCSNAIKFTPPGGAVHIAARQLEDDSFVLTVRDTGIGMTPEQIPVALEPFRQVASPFARNAEGTGLGLALVKSLIECHDGRLEIESALHKGTSVRLILPPDRIVRRRTALSA